MTSTDRPGADPVRRRRAAADRLTVIGLVGRAGSGKSTVARALERRGAVVLDADRIGHEITDGDPEVRAALATEYGPDVYRPDGALDRARVAARVFRDAAARERLNRLVHPRIVAELRRRIAALAAAGSAGVVVVDAALMLDWGFERECDGVIAVTAAAAEQVRRLMRARGWSEEETRRRLAAQRTEREYARAADETLVNDGTEEELERAAAAALERIEARRGGADFSSAEDSPSL